MESVESAFHLSINPSFVRNQLVYIKTQHGKLLHLHQTNFKMIKTCLFCFFVMINASTGFSQDAKKLSEAQRLFAIKNYDKALPLFLEAIQSGVEDPLANYQTGGCYQKMQNIDDQVKGIQFLEKASAEGKGLPPTLPYDLGQLYLKNEQLDKALETFTKYKELTKADPKAKVNADKAIEVCHNAIALMAVPRNFTVHSFSNSV